ncbi:MAG: hypothetical protein Q8867_03710 [Bacteroidota bacterium]|nr:hypothetical protein [Bacteroidota bacterium]
MKSATMILERKDFLINSILDSFALAFIYFAPSLAHLLSFPVYLIEPMRLMLVLSLVHSGRTNSYILALTLPFFSFLVSGHPMFGKMLIITVEMVCNVFLFYLLTGKIKRIFPAMLISIVCSKFLCYLLYLLFFSMVFVRSEAETSFLLVQVATTLVFSLYAGFIFKKKNFHLS